MRKLPLLLSFSIAVVASADAQNNVFNKEPYSSVTLRSNFMGLLDALDLHIPAGAEYRINDRWSAGVDLGYIFYSDYLIERDGTSGWLIRPFARLYSANSPKQFFEARVHYKNVGYRTTDWIDRDIVDDVATYQEYATVNFIKRVIGLDVMAGNVLDLSRDSRLKMELYFGIGVRWKKQGVKDGRIPGRSFGLINYLAPEITNFSLPLGARLTFALR